MSESIRQGELYVVSFSIDLLTLRILDRFVDQGYFNNRSEAVRGCVKFYDASLDEYLVTRPVVEDVY